MSILCKEATFFSDTSVPLIPNTFILYDEQSHSKQIKLFITFWGANCYFVARSQLIGTCTSWDI